MTPVEVNHGLGPIVLGLPHAGTYLPEGIAQKLNANGRKLSDTDWHIDRLYEGLLSDATTVKATFHRYVVDANRDPVGDSLYPGQNTTTLVPLTDFDGVDIWLDPPSEADVGAVRATYHVAYHTALAAELARVRDIHGIAILYDCHSIRSDIPFLFEGTLPDFNVGTNNGTTCAPEIERVLFDICSRAQGYTSVLNGRFKGGWTTRRYGQPDAGTHAIQMELAQSTYLTAQKAPWDFDAAKSNVLRTHLKTILNALADLAPQLAQNHRGSK